MIRLGILGALLILGLGVVVAWTTRSVETPAQVAAGRESSPECAADARAAVTPGPSSESAALRRELAQLGADVASLRKQMAERASEQSRREDAAAAASLRTPEARAEQEREWHEHMVEVDAKFQSEPRDPTWSAATSAAVRDALESNEGMRGSLRGLECRSDTCRVEIFDDRSGGVSKSLPLFVAQLGGALPLTQADHVDQGERGRLMTLYMTRAGLPPQAQALER